MRTERWDALMATHHICRSGGWWDAAFATSRLGEHWLALRLFNQGPGPVALPEQQFRRLHLIANNARFVTPGAGRTASRVLALSLRRLSEDMRAAHGHRVLLAETFVDRSRFTGASPIANWQVLLCAQARHAGHLGPPPDRRRSWSTRWRAMRASSFALDDEAAKPWTA